jgi:protocatechuate 3,4-dioxygenase beta subunit
MNKKAEGLILGCVVLVMGLSLRAQDRDERWLIHMIKASAANGCVNGLESFGASRSVENTEQSLLAIHNISAHFREVSNLIKQGWSEQEILAAFNAKLTTQKGSGSISGKITEKGSGTIQNYASVTAYNEFGRYCGYDFLYSNSNGRYKLKNLAPGKYYVHVQSSEYQDIYYRNTTDWRKAKLVRVNKNKETRNINFKLESIKGDGAISGQVQGKDGAPIMGCNVSVIDLDHNFVNSSETDTNGDYVVSNLSAGDYKICAYEESGVYVGVWYPNTRSFEEASIVKVTDAETTPNIDFILDYGGTIKGKVVGADGKPVEAYTCSISLFDMQENYIRSGSTDEKGQFAIEGIPQGTYKLKAEYYGSENLISCWYKSANKFQQATPIRVEPSEVENVSIKLKQGGIITGRVVSDNGQPLGYECEIIAYDENRSWSGYSYTDENGDFRIQGLESGRYKLFAEVERNPFDWQSQPVNEWYNGAYFFDEATFIKVTAPKTTANVVFSLSLGGQITGRVAGPFRGDYWDYELTVYAYNLKSEYAGSADVDYYSGYYVINGLPSGEYRVRAVYWGEGDILTEFYDNKSCFEMANNITVIAPTGTGNINFELDYAGNIQGFLTDINKNRVIDNETHHVQIYAFDSETGDFADLTENTFVSGYNLQLLEGQYKVAALSFYYNWMAGADDFGVAYHPEGQSVNDPATLKYTAKPGSAKKLSSMALKKTDGSISGTIYDINSGHPLTEGLYLVWVFDMDGYLVGYSGYCDCNAPISGEFRVGGLRPGNYYVLAAALSDLTSSLYDIAGEWYGGVELTKEEIYNYSPRMDIPAGAVSVPVSSSDTGRIDFYLDLPRKK